MLMSTGLLGRKSVGLQEALDPKPQRQPGTQGALSPTLMGDCSFCFTYSVTPSLSTPQHRRYTNSSQFYR